MDEQSVNTAGKELLDATQEAVIGAADNVETILKAPLRNWGRTRSLLPVARILGRNGFCDGGGRVVYPAEKGFVRLLGQHIAKETGRITDAENLKTEARKLLAAYEEKLEGIDDETAAVVKKSKREISALKRI